MAIAILAETKDALGGEWLPKCDSRSLFKDRFADPAKDSGNSSTRKDWFSQLIRKRSEKATYYRWLPSNSSRLYGRLMSRLMVNLAEGVMENANITLDRYGIPIIPGSAIKGCARRMALQSLHDWIVAQEVKGSEEPPAKDDACAPCCKGFLTPAEMLAVIARIFGWTPEDWKKNRDEKGKYQSDFAWAVAGNENILRAAKALIINANTFGGTISFLSASPNCDPGLELDVVTPHHTEYYKGDKAIAFDTEDPVPVFFPTVRAQGKNDYFIFPMIPLRLARSEDIDYAKCWLAHGLELLGIGAKTNAGYGWFDASEELNQEIHNFLSKQAKTEELLAQQKAEDERKAIEAEERRKAKEAIEAVLLGLTPEEQEDKKLELLNDAQFDHKVRNFWKETKKGGPTEPEKSAIIRALRGARAAYWRDFKAKASKGGDLAKAEHSIRALNKQLNGDKMP